jgi:putative transposase
LREAEVRIAQGETAGKICRGAGISEQTYYKWRREYGGLKIDQAKRLKELDLRQSPSSDRTAMLLADSTVGSGAVNSVTGAAAPKRNPRLAIRTALFVVSCPCQQRQQSRAPLHGVQRRS